MTPGSLNDLLARLDEERDDLCTEAASFIRAQFNTIEAAEMVILAAKDCIKVGQSHLCHAAMGMIDDFLRRTR